MIMKLFTIGYLRVGGGHTVVGEKVGELVEVSATVTDVVFRAAVDIVVKEVEDLVVETIIGDIISHVLIAILGISTVKPCINITLQQLLITSKKF